MKIFKKIAAGLLALALVISAVPFSAIPVRADDADGNPLRLWYDEPASQGTNILSAGQGYSDSDGSNRWQQQTLPIGNGDMGANVYGEIQSEHLTFNEKTLWTGGPSSSRPDYMGGNVQSNGLDGQVMEQVQELFLAGRTSEAVSLCDQLVGTSNGYGAYQPWGDIYFDYKNISTSVSNYQRDLDLTTAISTVSFTEGGTDYYREYFISHDDNVLVARLEANGSAKLNLDVRFTSKQGGSTVTSGNNTLVLCGQVSDNQLKYASYLTVVPEGGTVAASGSKLTVSNASAITVYLSAATDYKNTFWNEDKTDNYYYRTGETDAALAARVKADVDAAVNKGYAAVKASHLADYQELFDRVELDLGQTVSAKTTDQLLAAYKSGSASAAEQRQLEVMLFQYGRYLTIASSREDSQLPSNLQGVWNYLTSPPWASDYHMNVNLQMNYWPTYSTNLAECALPLIDYVDSLREPGRITAEIYNGVASTDGQANGFTAHTQCTPFGWTCPGWAFSWGWSPAAVPWILQNCWEYYEYTGDVDFMRDYIYPMLKEEALFYDQILIEDNDGKLVSAPAYSPEHGPYTMGNTYEQSLVWQLYEDAVIAAETLNMDPDLAARWKANQANLKGPIEVGESGQLKEWYEETTFDSMNSQGADAYGHRHLSHMLGLFPGDLVQQNEEWIAAARYSMEQRTDNSTGWGMGQRINTWARLGDGNKAHELIQNLFKGGIYPNLWDAHAPFQIDGNFGMTSGVAEMLVQSNMGYINLLPALPDVWAEGTVEGLVARGNFEISMNWTKGGITKATILSKNGGEAIVLADNITLAVVTDSKGNAVSVTKTEDGKISFDTVKGETYTLTIPERPEAPTNLSAVRNGLSEAALTWNAVAGTGITYNVYSQSDSAEPVLIASGLTETAYTDEALDTEALVVTYYVTASASGVESVFSNGAALPAPATRGMVDNLDTRIVYAGEWANWSESVNYNGSIMYLEGDSYSVDDTITLQFIGTGIEVITCTNYDRSYFEVFIDGVSYGEVDTYSASTVRQAKIFTEENLKYGLHTIVIKPLLKNNPSCSRGSSSFKLELDAFNVLSVETVEVSLTVGESKTFTDDSGYYVGADTSDLDTSVATVDITGTITSNGYALGDKVSAIESGKQYLLFNTRANSAMTNGAVSAGTASNANADSGLSLTGSKNDIVDAVIWTIEGNNGTYTVKDSNGKYLSISNRNAGLTETATNLSFGRYNNYWTIAQGSAYLNDSGNKQGCAAGWSGSGANTDEGSMWEIYKVTSEVVGTTTITFTGIKAGQTSVQIGDILYNITVTEAGHTHVFDQKNTDEQYLAAPADCENAATYYYSCSCGLKGTETFEDGEALGHDYGAAEYTWSEDGKTCTAKRTCANDAEHVETATATVTSEVTKAPTCEAKGETTYTATFSEDWAETQTKTVEDVAALGHAYGTPEYTWSEDGKTCTAKRTCANDAEHVETATATVTSEVTKAPTCEAKGETTYTAAFDVDWAETQTKTIADVDVVDHTPAEAVREKEVEATCDKAGSYDEVVYCSVCGEKISRKTVTVEKLAHTPAEAVRENEKAATCDKAGSYDEVVYCSVCEEEISRKTVTVDALGHKDANKDHKCDLCDEVLSECVDENKDYKCDICGKDLEKPEDPSDPVEKDEVIRLAGSHRWETALKVADEMKANLGLEKFDAIIIASGNDFADALAGSYLSTVKNAPILLGWGNGGKYVTLDEANIAYIKANLAENGVIYILGGEKAVPKLYEDALKGYNIKRLGGANRFETNLLILAEAGVADGSEILVCTSTNFADSLSASATAKPILLVFNEYGKLYGKQPDFLAGLKNCTFTVIGGESAVSADLAKAIETYGKVERLAGANRFETSVMVAQKYFKDVDTAVLAYAWNYPDGLCGGSLAYSLKAPLILTMTKYESQAVAYAKSAGLTTGLVLGGDTLISDEAVRSIFAMEASAEIIKK